MAKSAGHVQPVFELTFGREVPFYKLADLIEHFDRTGSAKADPVLLATMRENGTTFGRAGRRLAAAVRAARIADVGRRGGG